MTSAQGRRADRVKTTVAFRGPVYRLAVVLAVEHDATLSDVVDRALAVYLRAIGVDVPATLADLTLPDLVPAAQVRAALERAPEAAPRQKRSRPRSARKDPRPARRRRAKARRH